ncbi:hypothetical protein [Bacillus thuringiensis]|uniref:hypothetical protein n=1 Tax=Bacillus thuringiensis TaxID=1428 RepID=UPI003A870887
MKRSSHEDNTTNSNQTTIKGDRNIVNNTSGENIQITHYTENYQVNDQPHSIDYENKIVMGLPIKPKTMAWGGVLSALASITVLITFIQNNFINFSRHTPATSPPSFLYFFLVSMVIGFIAIAIGRDVRKQGFFSLPLISKKSIKFVELPNGKVGLTRVSAACPICPANRQGTIRLVDYPDGTIIGKCSNNPKDHQFTFDYMTFKGHRF